MNTEFIDSFRRPKLHGNFIMDLNPFSKLNLCALIAAFAGLAGGVASSVAAILLYLAITAAAGCLKKFWGLFWKVGALLFFFIFLILKKWPIIFQRVSISNINICRANSTHDQIHSCKIICILFQLLSIIIYFICTRNIL